MPDGEKDTESVGQDHGPAALIVNTRSRTGERAFFQALDHLQELHVPVGVTYAIRDPARLPETVRETLDDGYGFLILGGGDGSVSSVVDFLADRGTLLGLLPLGTANDFARTFLKHEPFSARLTFPEGDHEPVEYNRLLQVAVGNGRFYGGGMIVGLESGIDDKTLDVYAIDLGRHRDLLGAARYLKSGDFIKTDGVHNFRTPRVRLETNPELQVNIDGEVVMRTPQDFSVAQNALNVLVPQDSAAASNDE